MAVVPVETPAVGRLSTRNKELNSPNAWRLWQQLMATEAQPQAKETEKLTLLVAESSSGYFGVNIKHGQAKPYQARVWRGGKLVHLGSFATAEEAALCVARSPEG